MSFNNGKDYRKYANNNYGNRGNGNNRDGWRGNHSYYGGGQHGNYGRNSSYYGPTEDQNRGNEYYASSKGVDNNKRGAPPAAAGCFNNERYHNNNSSPKKQKSCQTYYTEDLTPEQREYRDKVASQLQAGERIEMIARSAFILREGWDALMKKAAEYAIEGVEKQLRIAEDSKAPSFSDCDSDSDISYIGNKQTPGTLSNLQKKYFEKLPECYLMRIGFDIESKLFMSFLQGTNWLS
jgi:hypothetical protein